jgi:hypothetical protein
MASGWAVGHVRSSSQKKLVGRVRKPIPASLSFSSRFFIFYLDFIKQKYLSSCKVDLRAGFRGR